MSLHAFITTVLFCLRKIYFFRETKILLQTVEAEKVYKICLATDY